MTTDRTFTDRMAALHASYTDALGAALDADSLGGDGAPLAELAHTLGFYAGEVAFVTAPNKCKAAREVAASAREGFDFTAEQIAEFEARQAA